MAETRGRGARRRIRSLGRWLKSARRRAEFALARRFGVATPEDRRFYLLIPVVGGLAGLLGVSIEALIDLVRAGLWGEEETLLAAALAAPRWLVVAAPAVGGLVVGLVIWIGRQPVTGHGMSVLIEAVALRQGLVPARPIVLSAIAAVITVGSGGSLGKEGPMIRLGAMVSSWLGERLGISPHRLKILVGCGAAAGLAAAYNIPVGGALFAMEVILGNFALEIFGPIVVSSVISTLIVRAVEGNVPVYAVRDFGMESGWELLAYLGLGIVGAVASIAFVFGVRLGRVGFARLGFLPTFARPMIGMALLGVIALEVPHVLGSGLESITLAVHDGIPWRLLLLLPLAKVAATALTSGSGGAGGMFTPSLFVGAMVGGAYGHGLQALFPGAVAAPGAYAAVGMAAIAAGSSHAPISAILILFEFTGNYDLILPLMVAALTASVLSRALYPYSVYEEPLRRQGVDLSWRMEEAALAGLDVKSLVRSDPDVLHPGDPYSRVVEQFLARPRQRLFVVDSERRLLGAVSLHDIKHVLQDDPASLTAVVAHDLMLPVERVLDPRTRLHHAVEVFADSDFERLPVVDPDGGRLLGVLAKRDVLAVYSQEVLGRPARLASFHSGDRRDYVELPPDFALRLVPVPPALVGQTLAAARLPQRSGVRVIELTRPLQGRRERVIPDAATVLRRGDSLIVIGPRAAIERLERGELAAGPDEALAHREID